MIKKTITYTNYNGDTVTEDFWFNLSKAELTKMELGVHGGFSEMMNRIIASRDIPSMTEVYDDFIRKSYGVKSMDGKRFIKSKELTEEFCQTEAYSELFMEFIGDTKKAIEFVNGVIPKDLSEMLAKIQRDETKISDKTALHTNEDNTLPNVTTKE